MKVWIDITAPGHVLVFRPLIASCAGAAKVEITSRDYAQTVQLLELHGIEAEVLGRHGGRSRLGKARSLTSRLRELRGWARGPAVRRRAGAWVARADDDGPRARDPELDHVRLRVRLAPAPTRLPCRDACRRARGHPAGAARALRRPAAEALQYPGLKEEYYLADFADPPRWSRSRLTGTDAGVVRTSPDVSLYHRRSNPLFPQVLKHLGRDEDGEGHRDPADQGAAD